MVGLLRQGKTWFLYKRRVVKHCLPFKEWFLLPQHRNSQA